jgi:scyllo-inosamine-4-phosphate amidinotransferase 1
MENKINSHTEWGALKEMIVGRCEFSQIPTIKGKDIHCVDYANYENIESLPSGLYSNQIREETIEDLDLFSSQLTNLGIKVYRPELVDHRLTHSTNNWSTDGYYSYCPRDSMLVIGDTLIETPMPLRSRFLETFAYKKILKSYLKNGSRWVSAPKPELLDELYDRSDLSKNTLTEVEPVFDAANIIKCGKDIFYLVSNSGNKFGAAWLQSFLGSEYRVHMLTDVYAYVHLDTTIMPLAPGVVLLNPDRINENNLPEFFKKWHKIWAADPIATPCEEHWAVASSWLGMNVLSINEKLVAVEERQTNLINQLEDNGFDVLSVRLRHCRTLSGGPHCVTLDTVRDEILEDYS